MLSLLGFHQHHQSLASVNWGIAGLGGGLQRLAGDRWDKTGECEGGIIGIDIGSECWEDYR